MTTYVALEDVMKYLDEKITYYDNDGSMSSISEWVHDQRFTEDLKKFKRDIALLVQTGKIRSS